MTNYHYWQYFLSLEADLITTSRYIDFTGVNDINVENNSNTFSTELLRIFLTACAECENILKIFAKQYRLDIATQNNPDLDNEELEKIKKEIKNLSIQQLRNIIRESGTYDTLFNQTISCPAYSLNFTPWTGWDTSHDPPQWWTDHNIVKHRRANDQESNYHLANLSNTLTSVAALMCLLFEYYKKPLDNNRGEGVSLPPVLAPQLFIPEESGLGFGNIKWFWQPNINVIESI
jgi:hypothetical protein